MKIGGKCISGISRAAVSTDSARTQWILPKLKYNAGVTKNEKKWMS